MPVHSWNPIRGGMWCWQCATPDVGPTRRPGSTVPDARTVAELDLASLRSVRDFADRLPDLEVPPLTALVCNAGLQVVSGAATTADGYEMTFGVNHLGHFALVQQMLGALTTPARIVVVSSGTHDPDKFTGMPAPQYNSADELLRPPAGGLTGEEGGVATPLPNSATCSSPTSWTGGWGTGPVE